MKVGVLLPHVEGMMAGETPRWTDIQELARVAESAGLDSVWLVDHLMFPRTGNGDPYGVWECWSVLAALAATTRRIDLGTFVICTTFRNPSLLAKMAATVEEISEGRLILGLGAGNNEFEHRTFGYRFDYRISRFEEALAVIYPLLRTGHVNFEGRYFQARDCELRPRGPRPNGPSIMLGTTGARGLRAAALYADVWNMAWGPINNSAAGFAELQPAMDAVCREVGRDPLTLSRSAGVLAEVPGARPYKPGYPAWNRDGLSPPLAGSPTELAEQFHEFARAGVQHLQVWVNPTTRAGIEHVAVAADLMKSSSSVAR